MGITGAWIITFDGACWPNPGGAMGAGWIIDADGHVERGHTGQPAHPDATNNSAEFYGLGFALLAASKLAHLDRPEELVIRGDSLLVINTLTGTWRSKKAHLTKLRDRCRALIEQIGPKEWRAEWIARELNEACDGLSKRGYREITGKDMPEFPNRRSA
jgi:ribonuclease HI